MALKYTGRLLPSDKQYGRDEHGRQRLPVSERVPDQDGMSAAGWRPLQHSTAVIVARSTANHSQGDTMRRLNMAFQKVELPAGGRSRSGKDLTRDEMYRDLSGLPVEDAWVSDGIDYSEDAARKMQSKINAYAKAGAGTFKTSVRGGKVFIRKTHAEYQQQRNG